MTYNYSIIKLTLFDFMYCYSMCVCTFVFQVAAFQLFSDTQSGLVIQCLMSDFVLTFSQNHSFTTKCDIDIMALWDIELAT